MLACGQASKQAWPNRSGYKQRGECRSMRRAAPSARQTRSRTFGRAFCSCPVALPWASHTESRVELNAALCKATRNKAGVDDLLPRSKRVKVPLGSQQLQPDQSAKHAYKLILRLDYNFTGWLSVVNFGASYSGAANVRRST